MRLFRLIVFIITSLACGQAVFAWMPDSTPKYEKIKRDLRNLNTPENREMIKKLDSFYDQQVATGFSGSVLIGYKGKVIYERYMGFSDKENSIPWSPATISQLASTSKPFTATAVLMLYEKGLLNIDEDVQKYLPDFPYSGISVRMLLCHRSGLRDYIDFSLASPEKPYLDNDDIVHFFATKKPSLHFTPNTNFKYSNSNYALLASIIEKASGMKYKYFMEKFLFKKLGLERTQVHDPNLYSPYYVAKSYKGGWSHYKDMYQDGVYGDKGIYSCVRDMYRWDQALYQGHIIKSSTIREAFKPNNFEKPGTRNYGLGWRMFLYPTGRKIIYHNGWWHGNNTCFYRFIDDNFTIIVLGNKFSTKIYKQPKAIYEIINGNDDGFEQEEEE